VRTKIGAVLLAAQLAWVLFVHFGPPAPGVSYTSWVLNGCSANPDGCRRWFAWAPNDYMTEYEIAVRIGGSPLAPEEIQDRYRVPAEHFQEGAAQHLVDLVHQYETTYGRGDAAEVVIRYRVNRRAPREWRWPLERLAPG
jgi:hypothetical protein